MEEACVLQFIDSAEKIMARSEGVKDLREAIELTREMYDLKFKRLKWMTIQEIYDNGLLLEDYCPLCDFMNRTMENKVCRNESGGCPLDDFVVIDGEDVEDGTCCVEFQEMLQTVLDVVEKKTDEETGKAKFWAAFQRMKERVNGL